MDLRKRQRLDYKQMNDGEKIPDRKDRVTRRNCLPVLYDVERIVSTKEVPKEGSLYLVKWKGYGDEECTWEPRHHLPEDLVDDFLTPTPSKDCIQIYSHAFGEAVKKRLKSRCEVFSLTFPHSLYRYVFGISKAILAERGLFKKLELRSDWDKHYRDNAVGIGLKFPVRIAPIVVFVNNFVPVDGKMVNKKIVVERLRVTSATGVVFAL